MSRTALMLAAAFLATALGTFFIWYFQAIPPGSKNDSETTGEGAGEKLVGQVEGPIAVAKPILNLGERYLPLRAPNITYEKLCGGRSGS